MPPLSADQWRFVSPFLDEALEMPPAQRQAWLAQLGQSEPALVEVLRALLREHGALAREQFLEHGPAGAAPEATLAGQQVGPWRLLSAIGQGGMGSVWLAERADGRFERKAAVKFVSFALAGRAGLERFKREGSILGRLADPHIAELLDAGVAPDGRPYLVLEYVQGEPIDRYCERNGLDVAARLRLFLDVLAAVAHAHASLIVHRDIKPSNVLVRADGQVKLLDFGIAKLLQDEGEAGAATMLTQQAGGALTPAYAAPEQLTGAPVTTATDVYSLGVLLYLLLTGSHPAGGAARSTATLVKAIVEAEPQRPSEAAPAKLRRALRGDLDTIVARALKKDPRERYASVAALAQDIGRYLAHEPVSARPDTFAYRSGRFLRRRWLPVSATAVVIASLSAGLYVAERQRQVAQLRFSQLRQLSGKVFDLDKTIKDLPGSTRARQALVSASLEYLEGLAPAARGDVDLTREIGEAYWRVAIIQGVPVELNLGDTTQARLSLKKADDLIDTVLAARPRDRIALLRSAQIAQSRMILAVDEHRFPDALPYARKSAERLDSLLRVGGPAGPEAREAASAYCNLALAHVNMHAYAQAVPYAGRCVELARSVGSGSTVSHGLSLQANALRYQGDLEGALRTVRQAREVAEQLDYPTETARMFTLYGVLLREGYILGEDGGVSLGRPTEAIEVLEEGFDLAEKGARKDPNDAASRSRVGNGGMALANILRHSDPKRALAVYDLALRRAREVTSNVSKRQDEAQLLADSAYALRALHRPSEAGQRIDAALAILVQTKDYPAERVPLDSPAFVVLRAQADQESEAGDPARAVRLNEELLARVAGAEAGALDDLRDAPRISQLYASLAALYRRAGQPEKALEMRSRRLELWRTWDRKLPGNAFVARELARANPG